MAELTVATINGEWMNDWFTADGEGAPAWRERFFRDDVECDTEKTASLLAGLITELDADVLALQEAPSRAGELALFLATHLADGGRPRYEFLHGDSGGAQKLALLVKPEITASLVPREQLTELLDPWLADVDGDAVVDLYDFTRDPLACRLVLAGGPLDVVVAHLKSNFINQGEQLWNDPARRLEFVKAALRNRRRIANEAMRIRQWLDLRLAADPAAAIVVLGDLNDGPGRDLFEQQYLAHNVTDLLLGSPYRPETLFAPLLVDEPPDRRYTAVFDDYVTEERDKKLLLDHIIAAPGMTTGASSVRTVAGSGRVEHEAWAAHRTGDGARRDERATDHRPASVRITTGG